MSLKKGSDKGLKLGKKGLIMTPLGLCNTKNQDSPSYMSPSTPTVIGTEEDARINKASLKDVYSLRVRTRLTTRVHVLVYIPSSVVDYWRISCPGRELADFVELSRGFSGPPLYIYLPTFIHHVDGSEFEYLRQNCEAKNARCAICPMNLCREFVYIRYRTGLLRQ